MGLFWGKFPEADEQEFADSSDENLPADDAGDVGDADAEMPQEVVYLSEPKEKFRIKPGHMLMIFSMIMLGAFLWNEWNTRTVTLKLSFDGKPCVGYAVRIFSSALDEPLTAQLDAQGQVTVEADLSKHAVTLHVLRGEEVVRHLSLNRLGFGITELDFRDSGVQVNYRYRLIDIFEAQTVEVAAMSSNLNVA